MDELRALTVKLERCFLALTGTYQRQPEPTKHKALSKLAGDYGIKIITDDAIEAIDIKYDAPTKSQVAKASSYLKKHLSIYPRKIIESSCIEQLTLVSKLRVEDYNHSIKSMAGLALSGYDVVDTLFLDCKYLNDNTWHGARLFHHELYHAIDYRDSWFGYIDREWKSLQGDDFKYGIELLQEQLDVMVGGNIDQTIESYGIGGVDAKPSNAQGFVSDYARISYVEDKAEIFASLICDYAKTERRAKSDRALRKKVDHMKVLLAKFCPDFNDQFWSLRANDPLY